jgi:hypothetical protein
MRHPLLLALVILLLGIIAGICILVLQHPSKPSTPLTLGTSPYIPPNPPPPSPPFVSQIQTGSTVAISTGLNYTLPLGWKIGEEASSSWGTKYNITDTSGANVAYVECPSLGLYEESGIVSAINQQRELTNGTTTYAALLEVDDEELSPSIINDAVTSIYPSSTGPFLSDGTPSPRSCSVFGTFSTSGAIPLTTITGLTEIYASWR